MNILEFTEKALSDARIDSLLKPLYSCGDTAPHKDRINALADRFYYTFPELREAEGVRFYSAPGRTEIGGNHTDHQRGCVLAAAVNIDAIAAAVPNGTDTVTVCSEGYGIVSVNLQRLEPQAGEENSPAALVRGIAARLTDMGYKLHGFSACVASDVPGGSGLSSSACFEVLIITIFNDLFCNNALDGITAARIGQFAENNFAGKPSGLLDQATAAVGGLVSMDFSRENPVLDSIKFDFEEHGYVLCVVNTGGSHADLTGDYAAVTKEMAAVANHFGKAVLSEVDEAQFYAAIPELRAKAGDRAILRALHYFDETKRALAQAQALRSGDMEGFLELVRQSGRSSEMLLQNIYTSANPAEQGVALGLGIIKRFLGEKGACRVHGGGFAGTVQAYIPKERFEEFRADAERIFGKGSCSRLAVRPCGGVRII